MAVTNYTLEITGLIGRARARADMVGSNFVIDGEVLDYLESAYKRLYMHLVGKYEDYFTIRRGVVTVADQEYVQMPSAWPVFLKLRNIRYENASGDYQPLRRIDIADLEEVSAHTDTGEPLYYCVQGEVDAPPRIYLRPIPDAVYQIRLVYVPYPVPLNDLAAEGGADMTLLPMLDDYLVTCAAIEMRDKEETDTSVLMADRAQWLADIEAFLSPLDENEPPTVVRHNRPFLEDPAELTDLTFTR